MPPRDRRGPRRERRRVRAHRPPPAAPHSGQTGGHRETLPRGAAPSPRRGATSGATSVCAEETARGWTPGHRSGSPAAGWLQPMPLLTAGPQTSGPGSGPDSPRWGKAERRGSNGRVGRRVLHEAPGHRGPRACADTAASVQGPALRVCGLRHTEQGASCDPRVLLPRANAKPKALTLTPWPPDADASSPPAVRGGGRAAPLRLAPGPSPV